IERIVVNSYLDYFMAPKLQTLREKYDRDGSVWVAKVMEEFDMGGFYPWSFMFPTKPGGLVDRTVRLPLMTKLIGNIFYDVYVLPIFVYQMYGAAALDNRELLTLVPTLVSRVRQTMGRATIAWLKEIRAL